MTIKRKLQFSNVLVIVFPTLVVFFIGLFIFYLIFGTLGNDDEQSRESRIYCLSVDEASTIINDSDYQQVPGNVTVYQGPEDTYVLAFDNEDTMPQVHPRPYIQRHSFMIGLIITTFLIFLLNHLIAKHILKSIMTPLDILANGVNEISNGNLDYRIEYTKKNEFTSVCNAFNDMASRLSDMTLQQQKEEQNRKVLIAGISHDLRTPLTSIKAYVVGLETGVAATPAMQKKYLATINQKASDLEYIINQLFLFSKLDVGDFPLQMEPVDIGVELEQLVLDMKDEYQHKGVSLLCSTLPTNAICTIDAIQFANVVQNIWSNTAKYKNKETAVSTIACTVQNNTLLLSISDNGPGVPEEALDKMFDVFYRADSSRQNVALGSGLGLAISAKIINRFQGTITARNLSEGGLCIDITLPLSSIPSQTAERVND